MPEIPSWGESVPQSTKDAIEKNRILNNEMINDPAGIKIDEFLNSEDIGQEFEFYKPHLAALKAKFQEIFSLPPRITNRFFLTFEEFKRYHDELAKNPKDDTTKLLAEGSRRHVLERVWDSIQTMRRTKNATPEYDNETERMMDEAADKVDVFCGWLYQSMPVRPKNP